MPSIKSSKVDLAGPRTRLEFDPDHGLSWECVAAFPCEMTRHYENLSGDKHAGPFNSSLKPGDRGSKPIADVDIERVLTTGGILQVSGGGQTKCIFRAAA
jgi:hypothetical protein